MPEELDNLDSPRLADEIFKQDFICIKDFQIKFYMIKTISKEKRYNFVKRQPEYLIVINWTQIPFDTEKERDEIVFKLQQRLVDESYISFINI